MFCCTNTLILPSQGARSWRIVGSPQLLQENILSQPWKPYSVLPSLCKSEWFYWHMNSTEQQLNLSLKNLQPGWASLFSLGSVQNLMQTLNMLIPPPQGSLRIWNKAVQLCWKICENCFQRAYRSTRNIHTFLQPFFIVRTVTTNFLFSPICKRDLNLLQ